MLPAMRAVLLGLVVAFGVLAWWAMKYAMLTNNSTFGGIAVFSAAIVAGLVGAVLLGASRQRFSDWLPIKALRAWVKGTRAKLHARERELDKS